MPLAFDRILYDIFNGVVIYGVDRMFSPQQSWNQGFVKIALNMPLYSIVTASYKVISGDPNAGIADYGRD
jgi:hypothetical protein